LGETSALRPLAVALSERFPVLFTSTSRAGTESLARLDGIASGRFWDNPAWVDDLLGRALALVIAETEFWPNALLSAKKAGVPIFLVNARVNRGTRRWRLAGSLLAGMLSCFTEVYPKDRVQARNFVALGVPEDRVIYLGGLKFDTLTSHARATRQEFGFTDEKPLVVFGSVRSREFAEVCHCAALLPDAQIAIAPRHMDRLGSLLRLLARQGLGYRLRSRGGQGPVLVLDTVGELVSLYSVADICFVGGTLAPYGGHNLLEPAALGIPVVFGPHVENQPEESSALISAGGGFMVRSLDEFVHTIKTLLADDRARRVAGDAAASYIRASSGATGRILARVAGFLTGQDN